MTTTQAAAKLRAKLTLDVTYVLNGMAAETLLARLQSAFERVVEEGILSGNTTAEVEAHSIEVQPLLADLDEAQVADALAQRIEDGDIDLERIPLLMARYGLMNPAAFINEMAERIAGGQAETAEPLKMRIFDGGTAPAAVASGYKMNGTVYSTPEDLMAKHGSEDLVFVYGAAVHGQPGVFEFARFEPISPAA